MDQDSGFLHLILNLDPPYNGSRFCILYKVMNMDPLWEIMDQDSGFLHLILNLNPPWEIMELDPGFSIESIPIFLALDFRGLFYA